MSASGFLQGFAGTTEIQTEIIVRPWTSRRGRLALGRMNTLASWAHQLARALLQEPLPRRWAGDRAAIRADCQGYELLTSAGVTVVELPELAGSEESGPCESTPLIQPSDPGDGPGRRRRLRPGGSRHGDGGEQHRQQPGLACAASATAGAGETPGPTARPRGRSAQDATGPVSTQYRLQDNPGHAAAPLRGRQSSARPILRFLAAHRHDSRRAHPPLTARRTGLALAGGRPPPGSSPEGPRECLPPGSGTSRVRSASRPRPTAASTPASGSPAIPRHAPASSARHSRPNSATPQPTREPARHGAEARAAPAAPAESRTRGRPEAQASPESSACGVNALCIAIDAGCPAGIRLVSAGMFPTRPFELKFGIFKLLARPGRACTKSAGAAGMQRRAARGRRGPATDCEPLF